MLFIYVNYKHYYFNILNNLFEVIYIILKIYKNTHNDSFEKQPSILKQFFMH